MKTFNLITFLLVGLFASMTLADDHHALIRSKNTNANSNNNNNLFMEQYQHNKNNNKMMDKRRLAAVLAQRMMGGVEPPPPPEEEEPFVNPGGNVPGLRSSCKGDLELLIDVLFFGIIYLIYGFVSEGEAAPICIAPGVVREPGEPKEGFNNFRQALVLYAQETSEPGSEVSVGDYMQCAKAVYGLLDLICIFLAVLCIEGEDASLCDALIF